MEAPTMKSAPKTKVVQAVVPTAVANEIKRVADSKVPVETVSRVAAETLCRAFKPKHRR